MIFATPLEYDGKPIWLQHDNLMLLVMPVGVPNQQDFQSMALAKDVDKNDDADFFIKKMTKEDFSLRTKFKFDCEHTYILARLFKKVGDDFEEVIPEDDENRLRIVLAKVPDASQAGLIWLNDQDKN